MQVDACCQYMVSYPAHLAFVRVFLTSSFSQGGYVPSEGKLAKIDLLYHGVYAAVSRPREYSHSLEMCKLSCGLDHNVKTWLTEVFS